jgi:cell division protein FtsW (lipid II flippase)
VPLPFFSYGGSGNEGISILLFIFKKWMPIKVVVIEHIRLDSIG